MHCVNANSNEDFLFANCTKMVENLQQFYCREMKMTDKAMTL